MLRPPIFVLMPLKGSYWTKTRHPIEVHIVLGGTNLESNCFTWILGGDIFYIIEISSHLVHFRSLNGSYQFDLFIDWLIYWFIYWLILVVSSFFKSIFVVKLRWKRWYEKRREKENRRKRLVTLNGFRWLVRFFSTS